MKPDQVRVHSLLRDTVTLLCKNGLNFYNGLRIEGVIGITVDDADVFLVHINDVFDSTGNEQITSPKSPQRTVDTGICRKSIKDEFRSSFMEQQTCAQRQTEEDDAQPLTDSLFAVPQQASEADDGAYFDPSANDIAAPSNNSHSLFDFNKAKIEQKHDEDDDDNDVVFVSPEEMPSDSFSRGHYMEQTQTEADSHGWKYNRRQYSARNRALRKQNPTVAQVVNSQKNSPSHLQEYEQDDLARFSPQQGHQQAMFKPPSSYAVDDEKSPYVNNGYSMHSGAIDSNNSAGDAVDLMPVDNSQQSFFGDSNEETSQGYHQNFATPLEVQQRLGRRTFPDQSQRKRKPGRPSQQISRDTWATVTATKFLCKMCGSSFNHRPSLLAHQINKHGRPKNRRGRPPTQLFTE